MIIILLIAVVGVGAYVVLANRGANQAEQFQTGPIERGQLTATIGATGTVRAKQTATLIWQAAGTVDTVNVKVGDNIPADFVMAFLMKTSLPQSVILAEADLGSDQQQLDELLNSNTQLAKAAIALRDAREAFDKAENWRKELNGKIHIKEIVYKKFGNRTIPVLKEYRGYASDETKAKADEDLALAQARLDDAQREYDRLDGGNLQEIAAAQARVDAAQATLNHATVTIIPPAEGDGIYNGREEIRGWYQTMVAAKGQGVTDDCQVDGETITCHDTYADEGLKGMGVDFIEGEYAAVVRDGKIQSYTFTISPESLAKFPPPEPAESLAGSVTDLLGVWWFPQAAMMIEFKDDGTYRVFYGSGAIGQIDEGPYTFEAGKITAIGCNDQPATYEAYLTVLDNAPTQIRLQVVGDDSCSNRADALKGTGQLQTPEAAMETEVRLTSPEAIAGDWKGKSGDYFVLHQFGTDGNLIVKVLGVGMIGTGPYVFEDELLKFEDATGDCAGLIGKYEVYGIYQENKLVKLRFAMKDQDPCTDRRRTLDGSFLTPD